MPMMAEKTASARNYTK